MIKWEQHETSIHTFGAPGQKGLPGLWFIGSEKFRGQGYYQHFKQQLKIQAGLLQMSSACQDYPTNQQS